MGRAAATFNDILQIPCLIEKSQPEAAIILATIKTGETYTSAILFLGAKPPLVIPLYVLPSDMTSRASAASSLIHFYP